MNRFLTTIIALLFVFSGIQAQPWMQNLPSDGERNFYDIQRAFNQHWEGKDTKQKGKGWKQFKRWEWFWEQRVYPTGEFPDPMQLYKETLRTKSSRGNGAVNGTGWTSMGPSSSSGGYSGLGRLNCVRVHPTDPNTILVGSAGGGLWVSTDNGTSWSTTTDELPSIGVTDVIVDPTNTNIIYIATGDGDGGNTYSIGVMKSTDSGATWNTTGLNWATSQTRRISRLLMHPANPNLIYAAGSGIHRTTDGGATWIQVNGGTFRDMEFKPDNPSVLYASGTTSAVFRSTNGGDSWSQINNGMTGGGGRTALGVSPANPDYVYALVSNASTSGFLGFYRSTNAGDSWSLRANSPNLLGWEIDGSDNGGQGWYDLGLAVSPTNADEVYLGGVNQWKSTDGGAAWTIISMWYGTGVVAEVHADQHDLWFVPGTNTLYSANDGGIYRTTDGGTNWQWLGNGLRITQFYRFGTSATNPSIIIAGAQDNGTKAVNAGNWWDALGGDGMEAIVDYSNENIMYGSLYYGDIRKSFNGGFSFTPITNGITEGGAWVTPYVMDPMDPNTLYAGFNNLWKTVNGGSTWERISQFGGGTLTILAVAPSDPNVIYAGRSSGLFRTTDGGATNWSPISSPSGAGALTYLAVHPTNPNLIWVTCSGYSSGNKVFRSENGGTTWANVSGALPNVPVNCIVFQNNSPDRLYVGTDIGVYYRDLVTGDWVDFNASLPNVEVTELEIQYFARKIRAATYGRGVWESDLLPDAGVVIGPSPNSIAFGPQEVGTPPQIVHFTITCFGDDTLTVSGITASNPAFDFINMPSFPIVLAPTQSVSIGVRFTPQGHGSANDSVAIASNALNGPVTKLPLSGRGIVIGRAVPGVLYSSSANPGGQLFSLNTSTGTATAIGSLGINELQALTIRHATQELYGVAPVAAGVMLYRASAVYGDALPMITIPLFLLRAIAFSPDDTLYAATTNGKLYRVNHATGDTTFIGTASGIAYSALSFHPVTGVLFASVRPPIAARDRIYTVSTTDGSATLVGSTGDGQITPSITFDPLGTLYGLKGSGAQTNNLISINTTTGVGTTIGPAGRSGLLTLAMRLDSITTSVGDDGHGEMPSRFALAQNYPNPFNPTTTLSFDIPRLAHVSLRIFDVLGREVATLVNGTLEPGNYSRQFDGSGLSSGLYLYRLDARTVDGGPGYTNSKKLLLMK
ncbi:MAG: T9SS type A sorting domain-containing protein [Bacteroidota bacterium]